MSDTSNPLNKRLSMQAISAGSDPRQKPVLALQFASLDDMHAAVRFIMAMRGGPHTLPHASAALAVFMAELGEIMSMEGEKTPADYLQRARDIREWCHDHQHDAAAELHRAVSTWSAHNYADGLPIVPDTTALNKILAAHNPFAAPKRLACTCPPGEAHIDCPVCGHPYLSKLAPRMRPLDPIEVTKITGCKTQAEEDAESLARARASGENVRAVDELLEHLEKPNNER